MTTKGKSAGTLRQKNTTRTRRTRSRKEQRPLSTDHVQSTSLAKRPSEGEYAYPITWRQKPLSIVDVETAGSTQPLKRVRLSRENLAHFNTARGTKIKDLSSSPTEKSAATTTSSTASGFALRIRNNGVLTVDTSVRPTNFDDIRTELLQPRSSPPPTELEFKQYKRRVIRAPNKATVLSTTCWMLLKQYDLEGEDDNDNPYVSCMSQQFTAFPENVGFNNDCSAPQPDFVEGLREDEFGMSPTQAVSGAFPYNKTFTIVLPHIAGEWKGYNGSMVQGMTRGAYDGAALVYARTQALDDLGEKDSPGEARVITFTTNGRFIDIFAHYASHSENSTLQYHQYRIESNDLIKSYEGFKVGQQMLRNAQDFAKEQSENLRDRIKAHGNNPPRLVAIEVDDEERYQSPADPSEEEATPSLKPRVSQCRKRGETPTANSPKRGRGRPRKQKAQRLDDPPIARQSGKRGRGRPRRRVE
ncbi:hypothetical protein O1611_g6535 [Lasiodiplodia mahajangana]|uniref:Uncharacterized protein n=1 Tax=Lasiodiplodia mahajangana TaxID=1108764 RepID=A0ACC2JIT7_9PEZI|nr:hypothetical protein O1611_g6535 [Lasiodiplodia mahajangana]